MNKLPAHIKFTTALLNWSAVEAATYFSQVEDQGWVHYNMIRYKAGPLEL
jgi:hypothetical protein